MRKIIFIFDNNNRYKFFFIIVLKNFLILCIYYLNIYNCYLVKYLVILIVEINVVIYK